jgi:hypothetical protein
MCIVSPYEPKSNKTSSIPIHIDNKSALILTQNPEGHHRIKHIDARHHFIRDVAQNGDAIIHRISGKDNPADMFTNSCTSKISVLGTSADNLVYLHAAT